MKMKRPNPTRPMASSEYFTGIRMIRNRMSPITSITGTTRQSGGRSRKSPHQPLLRPCESRHLLREHHTRKTITDKLVLPVALTMTTMVFIKISTPRTIPGLHGQAPKPTPLQPIIAPE
jgi:hypothetical protein